MNTRTEQQLQRRTERLRLLSDDHRIYSRDEVKPGQILVLRQLSYGIHFTIADEPDIYRTILHPGIWTKTTIGCKCDCWNETRGGMYLVDYSQVVKVCG